MQLFNWGSLKFWNKKQAERSFFNSKVQMLGSKGAVYLDTNVPYDLYNSIPELNQIVNKKANMFSNGVFKLIDVATSKEVEDKELMKLLEHPNVLESQNDFMRTYSVQFDVYGNQFIYKNKASRLSKYPSSLVNISPMYMKPIVTGKVFEQVAMDGIIEKYEYTEANKLRYFDVNSIIWTKNTDLDNPLIGCSPLKSIRFPLTNTKLAYDYLNCISGDKGAIGLISIINKDSGGVLPMSTADKQKMDKAYTDTDNYGIGVDKDIPRMHVVNGTVQYTPIGYPTQQLLLLEQIDANKLTIADHFGIDANILNSKNSTYENVRQGFKNTYENTIIPFADKFTQKLSKEIGVDPKYRLILDYSHLQILNDTLNDLGGLTDALNQAVAGGLLDAKQAQNILNNRLGI